jgi:transcription termination factor Rho
MNKSGTRKEELLLDKEIKDTMDAARQLAFSNGDTVSNMEILTNHIKKTRSNLELIRLLKSGK